MAPARARSRAAAALAALLAAAVVLAGCDDDGGGGTVGAEGEAVTVTSAGSEVIERRTEALPPVRTRAEAPPRVPEVRTYRAGEAGVVRVRVGERLRLLSFAAARGWRARVTEEEPDEIEVSFFRGAEEIEFEIEIERGELRVEVDRED